MTGSGTPGGARLGRAQGVDEPWPSRQLAGRATATLYFACGLMSLITLVLPAPPGQNSLGVLLLGAAAIVVAVVMWFLPWARWPRWVGYSRALVGFCLLAILNALLGDNPYMYAVFFMAVFVWIGVMHPSGTALKLLPFFIAAYLVPLASHPGDAALAAQSVVYVSILCLLVAEVPAWVVGRWRRTREALDEAHRGVADMCGLLAGAGRDASDLWRASAARIAGLVDVPMCSIFCLDGDGEPVCLGSAPSGPGLSGSPRPPRVLLGLGGSSPVDTGIRRFCAGDPLLSAEDQAAFLAPGEQAALLVPLEVGGQVIGLVRLSETRQGHGISDQQVASAESICSLVAMSVHDADLIEAERRHVLRLASLLDSSRAVATAGDLDDTLAIVARETAKTLETAECLIYEYDPARDIIVPRALHEDTPSGWDKLGVPIPLSEHPVERRLLASGEVLEEMLSDVHLDPISRASMETWGEKTCLSVPLRYGEESKGFLVLYERERERHFSPEEVAFASGLGGQAAAAIHNAQMLQRIEERNRRLAALVDAGRAMTSPSAIDDVLTEVAQQARLALKTHRCLIAEYVQGAQAIVGRACDCADAEGTLTGQEWSRDDDPLSASVLETGKLLEERMSDPDLHPASRETMRRWGATWRLTVPLIFDEEPVGLLMLTEAHGERQSGADDLKLAGAMGEQAAAALHNARLIAALNARNAALAEQARRLTLVNESSVELASTLDLRDVLLATAGRLCAALHVPDCDIYTLSQAGQLVCEASLVGGGVDEEWQGNAFPVREWGPMKLVRTTRASHVLRVGDERLGERAGDAMELYEQTVLLAVPLVARGAVIGLAELYDHRDERDFSGAEVELAESICRAAALAVRNAQLYESLEMRTRNLSGLLEASRAVSSSIVLERVLDQVARSAGEMLGSPECVIWEYEPATETLLERAIVCEDPEFVILDAVPLSARPGEAALLFAGHAVVETLSDPAIHPASRASMEECGEKTCVTVPLTFGDDPMGLLVVIETAAERRFTPIEVESLEALGEQAAVAIHNARLYRAEEEHARRLAALLDVGRAITAVDAPGDLLSRIARRVAEALGAPECIIFEYEPAADTLTPTALFQSTPSAYPDLHEPFALDDYPADLALLTSGAILVETISDPELDPEVRASMKKWNEKTCVSVPLRYGDERLGILVLIENERERTFTDEEIELLHGMSEQVSIALHNARQFSQLEMRSLESEVLNDVARAASGSLNVSEVAAATVEQLRRLTSFEQAGLLLAGEDGLLHSVFATESRSRLDAVMLADVDGGFVSELSRERVVTLRSADELPTGLGRSVFDGLGSAAVVGLFEDEGLVGALTLGSARADAFPARDRKVLESVGMHLSLAVKNARLYDNVRRLHLGNLRSLSSALTAKDYYTLGHSARVAAYAVLLATELGWPSSVVREVEEIAYLHDIGKIAVSDRILLKSGALTEEEWNLMRQHPGISAEIVAPLLEPRLVAGIRHHHERYDGTGYPDGLAGDAIPEIARLLCVVDSYDAMSSRRVYRQALNYADCLVELHSCRGLQLDADMVDAFVRVLGRLRERAAVAAAAAEQAAALIDPADHSLLRRPADESRAAYANILGVLTATRSAHPGVGAMVTQTAVDAHRCMVIVDSDTDPETRVPLGTMAFSEDQEVEVFAGREPASNVITVDRRGAWVSAAAPIRDVDGAVLGLVNAGVAPGGAVLQAGSGMDAVGTYASLTRSAAERLTRAEVDAITDALTGLYNHRHLQQRLADEVRIALERGSEVSLLFCDIDNFKELNDRFGHADGDEALKRVADIAARTLRRIDLAARYGGDELAIVLTEAGADEARDVAERLRRAVGTARLQPDGRELTISIGIASMPGDACTKQELLERADQAMYEAKRRGRNRSVCFCDLTAGRERRAATR